MRFGYWMPVFGGWLRNVPDEGMPADWGYVKALAVESERSANRRIEDFKCQAEEVQQRGTFWTPGITLQQMHPPLSHEKYEAKTMFKAKDAGMCFVAQDTGSVHLRAIGRNCNGSEKAATGVLPLCCSGSLHLPLQMRSQMWCF